MSIADGQRDLEIHYADPDRTREEKWTMSCSDLPHSVVEDFVSRIASGLVRYTKSAEAVESDDWLR